MKRLIYPFDIFARIALAAFVLTDPFYGMLVFWVFDFVDSYLLQRLGEYSRKKYLIKDLNLDLIVYFSMLLVAIDYGQIVILFALLVFRMIGGYFFQRKSDEKFLIYFPNFFEATFFVLVSLKSRNFLPAASSVLYPAVIFSALVVQLLREILMHYYVPKHIEESKDTTLLKYLGYTSKKKK